MNTRQARIRFHRWQGFTLVELMIALVVGVILVVIAIPSFSNLIRDNRMASAVNALVGAIHLTRMEAVRRNTLVTLCKSSNGTACAPNGNWEQGWIVFAEDGTTAENSYGTVDNGETILRVHDSLGNNLVVSATSGDVANRISFRPSGSPVKTGNIKVCDDRTGNSVGRELRLIASGRLQLVSQGVSCP